MSTERSLSGSASRRSVPAPRRGRRRCARHGGQVSPARLTSIRTAVTSMVGTVWRRAPRRGRPCVRRGRASRADHAGVGEEPGPMREPDGYAGGGRSLRGDPGRLPRRPTVRVLKPTRRKSRRERPPWPRGYHPADPETSRDPLRRACRAAAHLSGRTSRAPTCPPVIFVTRYDDAMPVYRNYKTFGNGTATRGGRHLICGAGRHTLEGCAPCLPLAGAGSVPVRVALRGGRARTDRIGTEWLTAVGADTTVSTT